MCNLGHVLVKVVEIMQEREHEEVNHEILCSGHVMAIELLNSTVVWSPAQDLHKDKPARSVNIPRGTQSAIHGGGAENPTSGHVRERGAILEIPQEKC